MKIDNTAKKSHSLIPHVNPAAFSLTWTLKSSWHQDQEVKFKGAFSLRLVADPSLVIDPSYPFLVPSPIKLARRDATTAKLMKTIFWAEVDSGHIYFSSVCFPET